jgi:glycerol-3-phosphate cytidylyltransferase
MKKGILFGTFDVWHPGYALMVNESKEYCDYLIVGLQAENSKKKLCNSIHERFMVLKSIADIDEIAIYSSEEELCNLLRYYRPDFRFLGTDYQDSDKFAEVRGKSISGEIIFLNRDHGYSTSQFKERLSKVNM